MLPWMQLSSGLTSLTNRRMEVKVMKIAKALELLGYTSHTRLLLAAVVFFLMMSSTQTYSQTVGQSAGTARAATVPQFRIDTDLYRDESKKPFASVQTIFVDGRYIEIDDGEKRINVFDTNTERITLIDLNRKCQTQIEMRSLDTSLNSLLSAVRPQFQPVFLNGGEPVVEPTGHVMIGAKVENSELKYRFKGVTPNDEAMAILYANYADWSVKLNAVYPPKRPPQVRTRVYEYLAMRALLPSEIRLTATRSGHTDEVVAKIIVQNTLSQRDQSQLTQLTALLQECKPVSPEDFFQGFGAAIAQQPPGTKTR